MPQAKEVAKVLRYMADSFDRDPEVNVPMAFVSFYAIDDKEAFLAVAKAFPRPFEKKYDERGDGIMELRYDTDAVKIRATVLRSAVCRVVALAQPAVYECEPLLSAEKEAELEASHARA